MSRQSLGRGLAALIPDDIFDDTSSDKNEALRMIPLDQIRPNPEQPRMTFSGHALEQLAESIRMHGVITPLLVRRATNGDGYILIAGERRLRASGLAGVDDVPAWVRDDVGSQEQLELALVENIQREDLDPIEAAESYRRLVVEFDMTQAEVARRVGKDRATIANSIRILKLPDFALAELRAGSISAGHAKALLAVEDDFSIQRALSEVLTKELSVRATERLVATMLKPTQPKRNRQTPQIRKLCDQLTKTMGTKVKVEPKARGDRGRIVIDYYNKAQLTELVEHMLR